MTNTTLLKELIAKSGLKLKYVADHLGLSAYGFSKKVNNEQEFKVSGGIVRTIEHQRSGTERKNFFCKRR